MFETPLDWNGHHLSKRRAYLEQIEGQRRASGG